MLCINYRHRPWVIAVLLLFFGQTLPVSGSEHHPATEATKPIVVSDHSHHHLVVQHHEVSSTTKSVKNCCDQQCDCDIAHCSTVFVIASTDIELGSIHSIQNPVITLSLVKNLDTPLYRPPISQFG